jgi:hypothetical protein
MTSVVAFKKIFERHLFAANIGLSFVISGLGDQIEQRLEKKQVSVVFRYIFKLL